MCFNLIIFFSKFPIRHKSILSYLYKFLLIFFLFGLHTKNCNILLGFDSPNAQVHQPKSRYSKSANQLVSKNLSNVKNYPVDNIMISFLSRVILKKQLFTKNNNHSTSNPNPIYATSFLSTVTVAADAQINVQVVETGLPAGGTFFYRSAGTMSYNAVPFSGSVVIPGPEITASGLEFYIEGPEGTLPEVSPALNPISIPVFVPNIVSPLDFTPDTYRMISMPFNPLDQSIENILFDDFGEYDIEQWRLFNWNGSGYIEIPSLLSIEPGKSYFLITKDGLTFDAQSVRSIRTDTPFEIELHPGWNQIGNPFNFPVLWSSVSRNISAVNTIAFFDGTEFILDPEVINTLIPWEGYFIFNNSSTFETISIPPEPATSFQNADMASQYSNASSLIRISAIDENAELRDTQNWVGFHPSSLEDYDKLDIPEAPSLNDNIQLSIIENNKRYAINFKPLKEDGANWDFRVSYNSEEISKEKLSTFLNFKKDENFPSNLQVVLVDNDYGFAQILDKNQTIWDRHSFIHTRSFRLIIGTSNYLESTLNDIPIAPAKNKLNQNYPNPFQSSTRIHYQLNTRIHVNLSIYNSVGQVVLSLIDETQNPGNHYALWDGRDNSGNLVASGIYFYTLSMPSFSLTRKMALVR